jgi:hypothetical protein
MGRTTKTTLKHYQRWLTLLNSCERELTALRAELTRAGLAYNERTDTWERAKEASKC